MAKYASPVVSESDGFHRIVTFASPGIRKNAGGSGENGRRNFPSNTCCATSALP